MLLAEGGEVQRRRYGELGLLRLGDGGGAAAAGEQHHAPAGAGGGGGGAGGAAGMVGLGGLAVGSVEVNGYELAGVRHRLRRPRGA